MKTKHMGWAGALAAGAVMAVAAPTFAHKAFLDKARKMYELCLLYTSDAADE